MDGSSSVASCADAGHAATRALVVDLVHIDMLVATPVYLVEQRLVVPHFAIAEGGGACPARSPRPSYRQGTERERTGSTGRAIDRDVITSPTLRLVRYPEGAILRGGAGRIYLRLRRDATRRDGDGSRR